MNKKLKEIIYLLSLDYNKCCDYLKEKYGMVEKDYFITNTCKSQNRSITRTDKGLYIHHIDEDKAIMLSTSRFAIRYPFEYQKKERLVYCDLLEHLLLHIKIIEFPNKDKHPNCIVGVGGVYNFMVPQLNDIYSGIKYKQKGMINCANKVKNHKDCYFELIRFLLKIPHQKYDIFLSKAEMFNDKNGSNKNNILFYKELVKEIDNDR